MSTLKVNRIEAYSGSSVEVVGLQATASNALWSGISGIPAGLVSGSYSSSMSTRITAQEDFSSSLDATFATDADVTSLSSSVASDISTNTDNITTLNSKTLVSGSSQIDLGSATGTAANATSASFATTASFALSSGGGLTAQTASTSLTMSANIAYVVTGTAAPITMSLPASPTVGELIKFANMDDRATLLGRNGNNIMGLAEDMTLNVEQVSFDLVYVGPTAGWTIYGSRALE